MTRDKLTPADLKRIRLKYACTQVEWAKFTGFSLVSVNKWERGRRRHGLAADRYYRLLDHEHTAEILTGIVTELDAAADDGRVMLTSRYAAGGAMNATA